MKKIVLLGFISALLVACTPKDEDYYFKHLDKAEEKAKSCNSQLEKILMAGKDEKALAKLKADTECQAAFDALNKQKEIEREKERAERELKRQQELEAKQKAIKEAKNRISQSLTDKNWEEIIAEYLKQKECNNLAQRNTPECMAWKEIYEEAFKSGEDQLSKENFETLTEQQATYCNLDKRPGSACDVWKKSWNTQNAAIVNQFINDDQRFVETYNQCYDTMEKIRQSDEGRRVKTQLEREVTGSYPCYQIKEAYSKRGLGSGWNIFTKRISLQHLLIKERKQVGH